MRLVWAVRRNAYFDSIDLMRVAEQARQLAGVAEVGVAMGTPPGRSMLTEAGMWPAEAPEAGPSDLFISGPASTQAGGKHPPSRARRPPTPRPGPRHAPAGKPAPP